MGEVEARMGAPDRQRPLVVRYRVGRLAERMRDEPEILEARCRVDVSGADLPFVPGEARLSEGQRLIVATGSNEVRNLRIESNRIRWRVVGRAPARRRFQRTPEEQHAHQHSSAQGLPRLLTF